MLVYGKNVLLKYLEKNEKVRKIIFQEDFRDKSLISLVEKCKIPYEFADKMQLDRLAKGKHQGIILDVSEFSYLSLVDLMKDSENQLLLILDHLEDPHNLGAIIRTSEAAGVDGIILPVNRSASVNATVMKTSAATALDIPICQVVNLKQAIAFLKDHGFWIVGTDMTGENYRDIDYRGKIALVVGNEGEGMSRIIENSCDFVAKIPMYGKVNSLNASVSAGIMIYEVLRQQGK